MYRLYFTKVGKSETLCLRKRFSVSDWADLLIPTGRKGKWLTMVVMCVGCLMLVDDLNIKQSYIG